MEDQIAKAEELEKKADKKIKGWSLFTSSKLDAAVDPYANAAKFFKLSKSWDRAGSVYIKLAKCNSKLDCKHEAARTYVDAAICYKKTDNKQAIECLNQAVNLFMGYGRINMSARYNKEIAELYEQEKNLEKAIVYYEQSAELFQSAESPGTANQLKQKVAQFSAQLGDYPRAIEIYEEVAQYSLQKNLLKYGVRGHLLNAGLCQLYRGDAVAINNAMKTYTELDPTFSRTREYRFLADLAAAVDEEDITKFTEAVREFNRIISLDAWKIALLSRVEDILKAKELEEDDLT